MQIITARVYGKARAVICKAKKHISKLLNKQIANQNTDVLIQNVRVLYEVPL